MTRPAVAFVPNWRPEIGDIERTVRDHARRGESAFSVVSFPVALARGALGREDFVVASDRPPGRFEPLLRIVGVQPAARLWWNNAEEALDYLSTIESERRPTAICFFADVARDLTGAGIDAAHVPYAFAPPSRARPTSDVLAIGYVGEVDISAACFEGLGSVPTGSIDADVWDIARAVVAGTQTLVRADGEVRRCAAADPGLYRAGLWSLRNRVRYLLVQSLVDAFPGKVRLRGDDWLRLGFEAEPTSFSRRSRRAMYRAFRVSLDLGSKSTHDPLYPRTAEILASGGGLVQFDAGGPQEDIDLSERQARSSERLIAEVERMLSLSSASAVEENERLRERYRARRSASASALLDVLAARLPGEPNATTAEEG